jgi:hypothetical protein
MLTGHYVPVMIIGASIGTVGAGLIYTLDVSSPASHWIPYQAIVGIGLGLVFQVPIIVCQAVVAPSDISSVTAIVIFFQTMSGSIFCSIAQSLFTNEIVKTLGQVLPDINPALVLGTGATDLKRVFSAEQMPGILASYMAGLKDTYLLSLGCSSGAVAVALLALIIDRRTIKTQKGGAAT